MLFPVGDISGYLSAGMSEEEILQDFEYLEKDDIKAALLNALKKINHTVILVNYDAA